MKKTEFKPDYAVPPIEIIDEMASNKLLTPEWHRKLETKITDFDAMLLEALFNTPRSFFLNLQRNYYETMARLEKEEKLKGVPLKQEWVEDIKEAFNKNLKKKIPREF